MPTGTVAICDPLPVMRLGLRSALQDIEDQIEEIGSVAELLRWADRTEVGTAVVSLHGSSQWATLRVLSRPPSTVRIVALVDRPEAVELREALRAGATSVVSCQSTCRDIADVVRSTLRGQAVVPIGAARELSGHSGAASSAPWSSEERALLQSLARGDSTEAMARSFGYSRRTMARRLQGLYQKLGAQRQGPALATAGRLGLIEV